MHDGGESLVQRPSLPSEAVIGAALAATERRLFGHAEDSRVALSRYVLLHCVASGGSGDVFAAYDPVLDRRVALKLISRPSPKERERTIREAQTLAQLSHPHVVAIFDAGIYDREDFGFEGRDTTEDGVFLVMELVEGSGLGEWCDEASRTVGQILEAYVCAGEGLAAAHRLGIVHRDFKPANVLVGSDGRVLVADFGLAVATGTSDPADHCEGDGSAVPSRVTEAGTWLGTPAYMAPEQYAGVVDARADQFSFCVSLYEALYKERPFAGPSVDELRRNIQEGRMRPLTRRRNVPITIERALFKGLAPDAADRHESMDELLSQLRWGSHTRRRRRLGVAVTGLLLAAGGIAVAARPAPPVCGEPTTDLEGVWNAQARDEVSSAFAQGAAPGPTSAASVIGALDAFAEQWGALDAETCAAAATESAQRTNATRLCLRYRRAEAQVLVQAFRDRDETALQRGASAVRALSDVSDCTAVESELEVQGPTSPEHAAERAEIREALARARGLDAAAQWDEAAAEVERVLSRAEALGDESLLAETYQTRAGVADSRGMFEDAERDYARAFWAASAAGRDDMLPVIGSTLVVIVGERLARPEEALNWGQHALAAIRRTHAEGSIDEAEVVSKVGVVFSQMGHHDEAMAHLTRALDILESHRNTDPREIGAVHNSLAVAAIRAEDYVAARAHLETSLEILERELGPDHPLLAYPLSNLATTQIELQDYDGAARNLDRARAMFDDPKHSMMGMMDIDLGRIEMGREHHERARDLFLRGISILDASGRVDHPQMHQARIRLGEVLLLLGDTESAAANFELALHGMKDEKPSVWTARALLGGARAMRSTDMEASLARAHQASQVADSIEADEALAEEIRAFLADADVSDHSESSNADSPGRESAH